MCAKTKDMGILCKLFPCQFDQGKKREKVRILSSCIGSFYWFAKYTLQTKESMAAANDLNSTNISLFMQEGDLDPKGNYILSYHPHGIISMAAFANFATEATGFSQQYPGIVPSLLTLASNFRLPLYRDFMMSLGMCSVSKQSCEKILRSGPGRSIVIVTGGASESLSARPGTNDLTLKKRFGFIKLAIRNNASLVPVFAFGENDIYEQYDNKKGSYIWRYQKWFQRITGFTVPLAHARGIFNYNAGFIPFRHPIVAVVGKPIAPPRLLEGQSEPTDEQLHQLQAQYIESLKAIYDKYKDVYAKDRMKEMTIIA